MKNEIKKLTEEIYRAGVALDGSDFAHKSDHFERLAGELYKAGYRKQSDTVKEFAEKIDLYLIKLFHQAHDSQKECEQHNGTVWENGWQRKDERMIMIQNDIQPFIRQLAEQYGKEEK